MGKMFRVLVAAFSVLLISVILYADEVRPPGKISLAKSRSYQEYLELEKWQNKPAKMNSLIERNDKTALFGGIGLASSYVLTVVIGKLIASSSNYKETAYYLFPVAGPFFQIPKTSAPYTQLCILSGVVQTGFFVILIYGLIKNKKSRNDSSFRIEFAPVVSKNANGITFRLRF